MPELPYHGPEQATPANRLNKKSRQLREHSRTLREDSRRLIAHFREVYHRATRLWDHK